MEIIYTVLISIGVIGLSFVYNYYRSKGVINDNNLNIADDLLLIFQVVLQRKTNDKTERIEKSLEIIRNTIDYIKEQKGMSLSEKQEYAINNIAESLDSIGIEVDQEIRTIIHITVGNLLNIADKK